MSPAEPDPPSVAVDDLDAMLARIDALAATRDRVLVGVTGPPGSGKSTLVTALAAALRARGTGVATVPMDGFHLADVELERLGRRDRKGAIDTFDGHGYLALLRRIRAERDNVVYAPDFERTLEQPIAGAVPVLPDARVVLTEGNYLLDGASPWREIASVVDEIWFCDVDPDERHERLVRRHVRFGKTAAAAEQWVAVVDEPNGERVVGSRSRADLIIRN